MEKFKALGLNENLLRILGEMHFKEPTEIQEKAIPLALAGKDIIGGSATGSGKTLAFGASILQNIKYNDGIQAIILTPTRELAEQVSSSLRNFAKYTPCEVVPIYGGVDIERQMRQLSTANIVVGTPGRVLDHISRRTLNLTEIKTLVLDEVDRMFDMGFQDDVERIIQECPKKRQTMLFSATISRDIDYLAKKHTKDATEIAVESYVDASQLTQVYYDVPSRLKFSLLVQLLKAEKTELVMIFSNTKRNADFIAKNLKLHGIDAHVVHGGLTQSRRNANLKDFHKGHVNVLVCTDVAARGLDIKNVSHVYNYDIPKTSSDYIHRIGRTARAGADGKAISILTDRDYDNFRAVKRDASLDIQPEELPEIQTLQIQTDFGRRDDRRGGYSRGGSSSYGSSRGGSSRGSSYGRSEGRSSYGRSEG
ncbi:DEAD/DEAH box helicase, partial [archaeon]|nr:DEAD/DEAH box helicase [archaeon]